jgi:hypothetical protein
MKRLWTRAEVMKKRRHVNNLSELEVKIKTNKQKTTELEVID